MVSESIAGLGEQLFPHVSEDDLAKMPAPSTDRFGVPLKKPTLAGANIAAGLGRAPFGIAAWKADLVTNPVKAAADMGELIKGGIVRYGEIAKAIVGDEEAKKNLKYAIENYPVETGFEIFMPLAALIGIRKNGKAMSRKLTGETGLRKAAAAPVAAEMAALPEDVRISQQQRTLEVPEIEVVGKRTTIKPKEAPDALQRQAQTERQAHRQATPKAEEVGQPIAMAGKYDKTTQPKQPAFEEKTIGLKKTEIESIRKNTGLDQLEAAERRGWEEVLHRAKNEKFDEKAVASADEIIKSGRAVSDVEHAGMVVKSAQLANEYDIAVADVSTHVSRGNTAAARLERSRAESILDQIDKLTEASNTAGREAARALSIRRMMVNREGYSLAHVMQRAQASKGSRLSTKETARIQNLVDQHGRTQKKLKELEANYDNLLAERDRLTAERVTQVEAKKAKIERRKTRLREKIQTERADIKKQLTNMGYRVNDVTGVTAEGSYLVGRLAVSYIKEGAVTLDAVVKKVIADIPQLTKRDVYQALITKDPKMQKKARVETVKRISQMKTQARLLLEIENAEKGVFEPITKPGQKIRQPAAIKQLQKRLRDLRAEAYKSQLPAARLEHAIKTINELQDQLANHYRNVKKQKPVETPELTAAREKIKEIRKTMHVQDELVKAQDQLRTGNFELKQKPETKPIPPELERQQIALKRARRELRMAIDDLKPATAKSVTVEAINTLRTLKATADMSATLRQGLVLSVRRPGAATKSFGKSVKAFFSENAADAIDNAIRSAPHHYLREKSKLYLSERGSTRLTAREEMFMARSIEKWPVIGRIVKASDRHMTSYLNMMRTAAFDQFLKKYPNATHAELSAWADFVNVASGRGNLGSAAGMANVMSTVIFAPRFSVSRIQTPYMFFKHIKKPRVRTEIAKDMVATASLGATALTLAYLAGAEVGTDPRSPDWGKMKFGDTRVDLWAGMQQPMRVVARIGLGITDKAGWTGKDLTDYQKDVDPLEITGRFSAYKLAPSVTVPLELYRGKTMVNEPTTPTETAVRAMIPLVYQDVADAWRLEGAGRAGLTAGLAFLGVGVNTYSRKEAAKEKIRALSKEGKRSSALSKQTRWNNQHPKDQIRIIR
jgi:hypothetical protein